MIRKPIKIAQNIHFLENCGDASIAKNDFQQLFSDQAVKPL